ncbi:MAG: hypothetical protein ACK4GN_14965 [Runella sp.]
MLDSITVRTDSVGICLYTFDINKTIVKPIIFFQDSASVIPQNFFLHPADTLVCYEKGGRFRFEGNGKMAKINRFLYQNGLTGSDSLRHRPLMQKVSEDLYASLMRDLADEKWQLYQNTQDTTDTFQNVFVRASLEGQQYYRVHHFLVTKDWTEEQFKQIPNNLTSIFLNDHSNFFKPPFRIVPHEDAILSNDYLTALTHYLGGNLWFYKFPPQIVGNVVDFYDAIDRYLPHLPRTRERLMTPILKYNTSDEVGQTIFKRFEHDFPNSPSLPQIRYHFWNRKIEVNQSLPSLPLLTADSSRVLLTELPTSLPTLLLLWNTWEDSCQLALAEAIAFYQKQGKGKFNLWTVCARNRFDSWKDTQEAIFPISPFIRHLYADYAETGVLEGMFGRKRPLVVWIDKMGKYQGQCSPFEPLKLKQWLATQR